jgi:hypothetical protein
MYDSDRQILDIVFECLLQLECEAGIDAEMLDEQTSYDEHAAAQFPFLS